MSTKYFSEDYVGIGTYNNFLDAILFLLYPLIYGIQLSIQKTKANLLDSSFIHNYSGSWRLRICKYHRELSNLMYVAHILPSLVEVRKKKGIWLLQ